MISSDNGLVNVIYSDVLFVILQTNFLIKNL